MMPLEPVRDIMRRTMANLEFVEARADKDGPYEVTQLLNSLLGSIAHPWEHFRAELNQLPPSEAAARGWPAIKKERPSDIDPASLGQLVGSRRVSPISGRQSLSGTCSFTDMRSSDRRSAIASISGRAACLRRSDRRRPPA